MVVVKYSGCFSVPVLCDLSVVSLKLHCSGFFHHTPLSSYQLLGVKYFLRVQDWTSFFLYKLFGEILSVHVASLTCHLSIYQKLKSLVSELQLSAEQFHVGISEGSPDFRLFWISSLFSLVSSLCFSFFILTIDLCLQIKIIIVTDSWCIKSSALVELTYHLETNYSIKINQFLWTSDVLCN